jgi:hypothetical protein
MHRLVPARKAKDDNRQPAARRADLATRAARRRARVGRSARFSEIKPAARALMDAKRELARLGVDWRQYLPGVEHAG